MCSQNECSTHTHQASEILNLVSTKWENLQALCEDEMGKPHSLHGIREDKLGVYSLIPFRLVIFSMQLEDKDSILHINKRYALMQGTHSQLQLNPSSLNNICFVKAHIADYYKSLIHSLTRSRPRLREWHPVYQWEVAACTAWLF